MLDFLRRILEWLWDLIRRLLGLRPPPPMPPPAGCEIAWQPSTVAPVFYGVRDYGPKDDAPADCRVFFPSLDGAVFDAPILAGCGRYPLIIFAHGNCSEPAADHYQKWFELPAQLARSGYVTAVPALRLTAGGQYPWDNDAELQLLKDTIEWMRTGWVHADVLLPAPATGAIGHSYGALLAVRLAAETPISAYASLSGPWSEWPEIPPNPIRSLDGPKLLTWGSGFGDTLSQFDAGWAALSNPKHKVVLADAGHWDYLPAGRTSCEGQRGECAPVWAIAADVASTFFGKYLPPEIWPDLDTRLPHSLLPPARNLTPDQQFFAGGHLASFDLISKRPECGVTLSWSRADSQGSVTRP